jgi:hypothetical protein
MPGRDEPIPPLPEIKTKLLVVPSFGGQVRPYGAGSGQTTAFKAGKGILFRRKIPFKFFRSIFHKVSLAGSLFLGRSKSLEFKIILCFS